MISPKKKSKNEIDRGIKRTAKTSRAAKTSSALAFWKEEVETLREGAYDSYEEAIDALISKVTIRLSGLITEEEASFLRDTIALDPEMKRRISALLRIKKA